MTDDNDDNQKKDSLAGAVTGVFVGARAEKDELMSIPGIPSNGYIDSHVTRLKQPDLQVSEASVQLSTNDAVLEEFDLRELRVAALVLAETGMNMPNVRLYPQNDIGARETGRYIALDTQYHSKERLLHLVRHNLETSKYAASGMGTFNEEIKSYCEKFLTDKSSLSWLKDGDAALWVWCHLKNISISYFPNAQANSIPLGQYLPFKNIPSPDICIISKLPRFYSVLGIPEPELKSSCLYDAILCFFDSWLVDNDVKYTELDAIKKYWIALNKQGANLNPFSFLDKASRDDILWCWDYVEKKIPMGIFQTTSDKERRILLSGVYLAWLAPPDSKKLFIHELRRAWSQRKFREKTKSRKLFQAYIAPDRKRMLTELASDRGMKLNETVEKIIEDAYFLHKEARRKR